MNSNEILELVRAGYSKAEIEAMNQEMKPDEESKPAEEVKQPSNENNDYKALTDIVKNLTETVRAMQAENAKKASGEPPKTENAESAIKSFFGDIPKN